MFIPASSEFVALCKSQVAVLNQGLGAALSAVYLTKELVEGTQTKLIPIVVYPEPTGLWEEDNTDLMLPEQIEQIDTIPRLLRGEQRRLPQAFDNDQQNDQQGDSTSQNRTENVLRQHSQVVLPLMHEDVVLGLLVTGRDDRPWNEREKATIERIARTLTIAYIMDQRRVWVEQQLTQQSRLHAQQHDRLDDLLHQFRNPLTAVRTFGKLLLKRLRPGDKNREAASSILRESERLQELLQQFDACLDMNEGEIGPLTLKAAPVTQASQQPVTNSQPEATQRGLPLLPGQALTLESFSLAAVLEPLLVSAKAIAQERNLELQAQIPTDLPLARGNAKALREVLSNLIDNALKYTPAGGQIDIRVGEKRRMPQGDMIGIAISDTGPGIPPQDLEHLFERHYRGVQAATAIPGSGLGLAIAKELIEQMHGEIEVFSPARPILAKQKWESALGNAQDNAARGTTFVVWLLLTPPGFEKPGF